MSVGQHLLVAWGVLGVVLLVLRALWRLAPIAWEPVENHLLTGWQALVYATWVVFNAYFEGYRGFHRSFSPRVVRRAFELVEHPSLVKMVLAPAYCMSLFAATKRRMVASWILVAAVTALVLAMRLVSQPWRGIVDGGVVVGLTIGCVSLLVHWARALGPGTRHTP